MGKGVRPGEGGSQKGSRRKPARGREGDEGGLGKRTERKR